MTDDQREMLQAAGCEALEGFRKIFKNDERPAYKMTLVARNAEYSDGSRDVIVTEDEFQDVLDAVARGKMREHVQ